MRCVGHRLDAETGLFYNYRRDYDPQTGRYVQSDPIGLLAGLNTYLYVGGNPLSFVDPSGLITLPEAEYLGGLLKKGGVPLSKELIKILSMPGSAGAIAAAQLCADYGGRTPRDLFGDCTTICLKFLQMIQGLTVVAGGWLTVMLPPYLRTRTLSLQQRLLVPEHPGRAHLERGVRMKL